MIIREEYLVKKNNKNRIQVVLLQIDRHPISKIFSIYRTLFQYGGKKRENPIHFIKYGTQGRSVSQEAGESFNKYQKIYIGMGYKQLSRLTKKHFDTLTEDDIKKLLNQNNEALAKGLPSPVLPKNYDTCSSRIFERDCFCSRRISGVRVLIYFDGAAMHTASLGGKTYDNAVPHLLKDAALLSLFQVFPDLVLDGEIYHFGWSQDKILGLCKLEEPIEESKELQFWIYDYVSKAPFIKRAENLAEWKQLIETESTQVIFLEHVQTSGWFKVKRLHDQWSQEGYDGLVARFGERPYGAGRRSANYVVEMQQFQEDKFLLVDIQRGFRIDDSVFVLQTKTGKNFNAKPILNYPEMEKYITNKNDYIGKMATVRFFYYESNGLPSHPVLKSI